MLEQSIVDNLLPQGNCLNILVFFFSCLDFVPKVIDLYLSKFSPLHIQELLKTTTEAKFLLLTVGQDNTVAGGASCPSLSNVLHHMGQPQDRDLLLWSASPTSEHQRTTATGEVKV